MTPPRRAFFVHLQKTAGTALFRRLRHHFGVEAVYPRPEEQGTPEAVLDVDLLRRRLDEEGDALRCVTGHFPLATVDLLGGDWATFTILRDPVERVLSFLRHQREVESRFQGWDLDRVYDDPVTSSGLVHEHMVKMLSLSVEEMTAGALSPVVIDDAHLEAARRNLAERIDVVGLQEHFEDFCADLEATFGWDLGEPVFMNRTAPADVPPGLVERIAADNPRDVALYESVRRAWVPRSASP